MKKIVESPSNLSIYFKDVSNSIKDLEKKDVHVLMQELISLEKKFLSSIRKAKKISDVYTNLSKTINFGKDASQSKTYFRVKYDKDVKILHKHVGRLDIKELQKYPINHKFCLFVINSYPDLPENSKQIYAKIKEIRDSITKSYLHFAIHQAKVFKTLTPGVNNDFDDLIQIANIAILSTIDSYVFDKNSAKFYQRAIGKILGALIYYSTTQSAVHMTQNESRLLYKIKRYLRDNPNSASADMAAALEVAEQEVIDLLAISNGAQSLNANLSESDSDYYCLQDTLEDLNTKSAENVAIEKEIDNKLKNCYNELSILERKVLRLKGVKLT